MPNVFYLRLMSDVIENQPQWLQTDQYGTNVIDIHVKKVRTVCSFAISFHIHLISFSVTSSHKYIFDKIVFKAGQIIKQTNKHNIGKDFSS